MKKLWIFLIIFVVFIVSIFVIISIKSNRIEGRIIDINEEDRIITIRNNDQDVVLDINNQTKLLDSKRHPALFSDFNLGFDVIAKMKTKDDNLVVDWIRIEKSPKIIILNPENNASVKNMVKVEGVAQVFENKLQLEVKNKENKDVICSKTIKTHPIDIGMYGPFEEIIDLSNYDNLNEIEINVFQYSNVDKEEVDRVSIDLSIIK